MLQNQYIIDENIVYPLPSSKTPVRIHQYYQVDRITRTLYI